MPYFKLTKGVLSLQIEPLKKGDVLTGKTVDGDGVSIKIGEKAKMIVVNGEELEGGGGVVIFETTSLEKQALVYLSRRKTRMLKNLLINAGPAGIQDGLQGLWKETEIKLGLRKPDEGSLGREMWYWHTSGQSEVLRTGRKE